MMMKNVNPPFSKSMKKPTFTFWSKRKRITNNWLPKKIVHDLPGTQSIVTERESKNDWWPIISMIIAAVKGVSTYEADPLPDHFNFFRVLSDATGQMSLSVIMRCTRAIRQLAYGITPDAFDEYLQMSERTARDCLFHFNKCIISLYMVEYLRKPTLKDVENIYNKHLTTHGLWGMLESIDCMHWKWKNYPVSWQGQYGANNDINVLDNSSLFDDLLDDKAHVAPYVVNGVGFENGYYLADGIYPQWATFMKSFTVANDAKHVYFKKRQEGAQKDVERAFGVLQGRWRIIQQTARQYHVNTIRRIMYSCIIT
uniref:Protein ALP1-like n=1 Tax=Tanacetum cinerariifolium TaxID=118510 RepID=A0A699I155_TANCI|nr:hypothetical protein [Tanacetum cinerariifolium]